MQGYLVIFAFVVLGFGWARLAKGVRVGNVSPFNAEASPAVHAYWIGPNATLMGSAPMIACLMWMAIDGFARSTALDLVVIPLGGALFWMYMVGSSLAKRRWIGVLGGLELRPNEAASEGTTPRDPERAVERPLQAPSASLAAEGVPGQRPLTTGLGGQSATDELSALADHRWSVGRDGQVFLPLGALARRPWRIGALVDQAARVVQQNSNRGSRGVEA